MVKRNWEETRDRFVEWWNRRGIVLGQWGYGVVDPRKAIFPSPPEPRSLEQRHTDPTYLVSYAGWDLARRSFPVDSLPLVCPGIQTVELASYLGAELSFDEQTIWYSPSSRAVEPENLALDEGNKWYRRTSETLRRQSLLAGDRYLSSLPAISPGLDVLAEVEGIERLLTDLVDRPGTVGRLLDRIDDLFFRVHGRFSDMIRRPDGSTAFYYFMLWSPGTVTQLQCDVAAMISPAMFEEFVLPGMTRIADRIDHTLFHVDGPPMLQHIELLLTIESLDAIEFTPGPGVPPGGDRHWYDLYRKVLDAGKSIQVVVSELENIEPLLDALGANGVYLLTLFDTAEELEQAESVVSRYRKE